MHIEPNICGIYKIENLINGKVYIGKSVDIKTRIQNHLSDSFNEKSSSYNVAIHRAIRKYGIQNFKFDVLESCDRDCLSDREMYWINYYQSFSNGYNLTLGGEGVLKADKNEIYRLWDEGLSIAKIAKILGNNKHTIINILSSYKNYSKKESISRGRKDFSDNKSKPVYQFDFDGNLICKYMSAKDAERKTLIKRNLIVSAISGNQKSAGGYLWSYTNKSPKKYIPKSSIDDRPVLQFDKSGNFIKEYKSLSDATRSIGLKNPASIFVSCKSKTRTAAGFIWRYKQ